MRLRFRLAIRRLVPLVGIGFALSGCGGGGGGGGGGASAPLMIAMFAPLTFEATSNESARVTMPTPATSGGSGAVIVTCNNISPGTTAVFTLGTTPVSCVARDATGASAQGTSSITVLDTHPPTLAMFAPITAEATSPAGATVTVPASVAKDSASTPVVNCPSGPGVYPLGVTPITCRATDGAGNVTTGTSTVTVVDTVAPMLAMWAPITVLAADASGAFVTVPAPVATDAASVPMINCGGAIGRVKFAIGRTVVTCKASDAAGNVTTASSSVTVIGSAPISGTVSGLTGTVVLRDNGTDSVSVSANGPFHFATPIAVGASYNVTVATQPAGKTCTVTNGTGVVASAAVTNVQVTCTGGLGAPTVTLTFGLKQLNFSWPSVPGATAYKLMRNPDGASGFTQVGADLTTPSAALDIAVYRQNWSQALYMVQACNAGGCVASNPVNTLNAVLRTIGYFKASNTRSSQLAGYSVALSADGQTLAIGASGESSNATGINGNQADVSQSSAGAVYVYTRTGGTWSATPTYIKASNTTGAQFFGWSVSLSGDGNTLAVGAFGERSNATGVGGNQANTSVSNAGAVYVYRRTAGAWGATPTYVKASNTTAEQHFGYAVALSADASTLAVGAYGETSNATGVGGNQADVSMNGAGAVYVYTSSGGVWSGTPAYLKASNTKAFQDFGAALALSADGNTLAIGALGEKSKATGVGGDATDVSVAQAGAVYVYARSGGVWGAAPTYVKSANTAVAQQFGYALALSGDGNTLAVGAPGEASNATGIGGNAADTSASLAGAAYVYSRSGGTWSGTPVYVKASNTRPNQQFGEGVALSSDGLTLAVGAGGEASSATGIGGNASDASTPGAGAVYVYAFAQGAWSSAPVYVKATNTASSQAFGGPAFVSNSGVPVALSSDGSTLAVGAPTEQSNATGIDGNAADKSLSNAGAVYLY